jgi:DNA-binding LacI/PurR family transcriptional regulator
MNIGKIAKRAKVSTATVSRTINGSDKVTAATAERVWRVVRSMGYRPNSYARALVSGRSRMLGLIISDIVNPFFPELVRSFEDIALKNGYEVIVANTGYDPERMAHSVSRMLERQVEGVAVITSEMGENFVTQMAERRIPMVFLDTARVGPRVSKIKVDYSRGIGEAVEHIVNLGHKRIAFISGPTELRSAETRRSAFLKCLHHYDVLPDKNYIQIGNHRIDGGEAAMERLLALPHPPTAVLTSNDLTAMGVLRAIHKARLRVPEDISVVGFDDIEFSEFTQPALTTVRLSRTEVADKAFSALAKLIGTNTEKGSQFEIETNLVVRDSTGPVPRDSPYREQRAS